MKPICVPCRRFYRPKKNGVRFIEGMPRDNDAPRGTSDPRRWEPYKVWMGDLWFCVGCGAEIIAGCGFSPIVERHQQEFAGEVTALGDDPIQINDC